MESWSDFAALTLTSGFIGIVVKEIFDIFKGKTRLARQVSKWEVWGWTLWKSLARDGVDTSKYDPPPE